MGNTINVRKTDGTVEVFDESKLKTSLKRSRASERVINEAVQEILATFGGKTITSSQIFNKVFNLLKRENETKAASRYSLKRAVLDLGPSGFPFEYFLSELYNKLGYKTETGAIIRGGCATHEVDVVAENDDEIRVMEAKFHNSLGFKTDLKIMLYVSARILDLMKNNIDGRLKEKQRGIGMIVTNTAFTTNAIAYAECVGVEAISWDYPEDNNLHGLIERSNLHPITALTKLSDSEKKILLEKGIVLCGMVEDESRHLIEIGLSEERIKEIIEEVKSLCRP